MSQIEESDFRDTIIAIKKDAKLVAAAKNDRTNSMETLYREFEKLTVERRRELLIAICNDYFTASQWKIAFPLNNLPAAILPDAMLAAGKALFFSRDEDSVRETIRVIKLYENSPFIKRISLILADAAEIARVHLAAVCLALTDPEVFGLLNSLEAAAPPSELIITTVGRVATYTRDSGSTGEVAQFLIARRYSATLPELAGIVDEAVFMARDRRSVRQILQGLGAGGIDVVLQRKGQDPAALSAIREVTWRSRNWRIIRDRLATL